MAQPQYDTVEPDALGQPASGSAPTGCPVHHSPIHHSVDVTEPATSSTGCPVAHDVATKPAGGPDAATGPCIDDTMRRLLRIKPNTTRDEEGAQRVFEVSILISAARCLLFYVVFPIIAPSVGAATGVGPYIGIPVGIIALFFDVFGIRRFWAANHKWRKQITVIYLFVIVFVSVLLVSDIVHLLT